MSRPITNYDQTKKKSEGQAASAPAMKDKSTQTGEEEDKMPILRSDLISVMKTIFLKTKHPQGRPSPRLQQDKAVVEVVNNEKSLTSASTVKVEDSEEGRNTNLDEQKKLSI